jgi:hypothetical protein
MRHRRSSLTTPQVRKRVHTKAHIRDRREAQARVDRQQSAERECVQEIISRQLPRPLRGANTTMAGLSYSQAQRVPITSL